MHRELAQQYDAQDSLSSFRDEFAYPDSFKIYLCGNSLGLLPKRVVPRVDAHVKKWATQAVEGHFTEPEPWVAIDELCRASMAR